MHSALSAASPMWSRAWQHVPRGTVNCSHLPHSLQLDATRRDRLRRLFRAYHMAAAAAVQPSRSRSTAGAGLYNEVSRPSGRCRVRERGCTRHNDGMASAAAQASGH
jgi:hypothetical protein